MGVVRIHFPLRGGWAKIALDWVPDAPLATYLLHPSLQQHKVHGLFKTCHVVKNKSPLPIPLSCPLNDGDEVVFVPTR